MRTKHLLIGATALGLLLAACGSDDKASDTTKAAATTSSWGEHHCGCGHAGRHGRLQADQARRARPS